MRLLAYSSEIRVASVITTLRILSNWAAAFPVKITPSSIRDRKLETVMFALPMYPLFPRSALIALK